MKKLTLAVVASILLALTPVIVSAEVTPKFETLIDAATVNGTAFVDSKITNLERTSNPEGIFGLAVSAESVSGTADIKIEVLVNNPASNTWTLTYFYYDAVNDALTTFSGLVIDSTVTRLGGEGSFYFFPVQVPLVGQFLVRVTGVGANPADSVVTVVLVRK